MDKVQDLCHEFDKVEKIISYCISLHERFGEKNLKLIKELCSTSFETNLTNEEEIKFIKKFISYDGHIENPEAKEIICRAVSNRKSKGKLLSHKIYTLQSQNELRIATAISKGIPF
jgi:hypothetical protein